MRAPWKGAVCLAALSVLALACGGGGGGGGASTTPSAPVTLPMVNGVVTAIAVASDGTTYLGGNFNRVGTFTGSGVPLDATTGAPLATFPKVEGMALGIYPGVVLQALGDGSGGWFICGTFDQVGGAPRKNIAHLLANGTVDPAWDARIEGEMVKAMKLSGSTLFIGGAFTHAGGYTRNGLAALDATTSGLLDWCPLLRDSGGVNPASAGDLEVSGGNVYVGGDFKWVGWSGSGTLQVRNYLAAFNGTTGEPLAWDPNASSSVSCIVARGGSIYVGGSFHTIGGATRNRLAELNTAGAATAWDPAPDDTVNTLAVKVGNPLVPGSTTLLAGGSFHNIGGAARNHLAELSLATGAASAWNPNPDNKVLSMSVQNGLIGAERLFVAGDFANIGGAGRTGAAELNLATGQALPWNPDPAPFILGGGTVGCYAIAIQDEVVYLGGVFASVGGTRRQNLAAIDGSGHLTGWSPEADGVVACLALDGDRIYLGGDFTAVGQETRNRLAAVDLNGNLLPWDPGADHLVWDLAVQGGTVFAGGEFETIAGQPNLYLAALDNQVGNLLPTWHSPVPAAVANNGVYTLALRGSALFAGGLFATTGARTNLIAVDGATGAEVAWTPLPNGPVHALTLSGDTLFAGGSFTTICGAPRKHLAALRTSSAAALVPSWNSDPDQPVASLALAGSTLYACGPFTQIGGVSRVQLAALDATTGLATPWVPKLGGSVARIRVNGSRLCVGGLMIDTAPSPAQYLGGFTWIDR